MSEVSSASSTYPREDFVLLVGAINRALLLTHLSSLVLSVPIVNVTVGANAVRIDWADFPSTADRAAVASKVATFVGGATTKEPITVESFAVLQAPSNGSLVRKALIQTLPLEAGTYTFSWNSTIQMNPANAAGGVKAIVRITRSDGEVREQPDSWDLAFPHAYNGNIIFTVAAGQTLLAEIFVQRLGSAGTAEMLGVRLTIDQRSPAAS